MGRPITNQRRYQPNYQPKCQFCDNVGHTAKSCPQLQSATATANSTFVAHGSDPKWLMDSAASHNITGDLNNLTIHSEYDGSDEVVLGDGSGLPVSHIGSLILKTNKKIFSLKNTLCVPNISKNLISVHRFTLQNNVFIEFHPYYFLVKDRYSRVILARGSCEEKMVSTFFRIN